MSFFLHRSLLSSQSTAPTLSICLWSKLNFSNWPLDDFDACSVEKEIREIMVLTRTVVKLDDRDALVSVLGYLFVKVDLVQVHNAGLDCRVHRVVGL